jgi:hypothetical protein
MERLRRWFTKCFKTISLTSSKRGVIFIFKLPWIQLVRYESELRYRHNIYTLERKQYIKLKTSVSIQEIKWSPVLQMVMQEFGTIKVK